MIKIGMTTFHEHGSLLNKTKLTLEEYASYFPIVELDTCFYGIKSPETSQSWVDRTPSEFKFILKVYKGMTKHGSWDEYYESEEQMFLAYQAFIEPLKKANKLAFILFQFPASFNCTKENVAYLRKIRNYYKEENIAVEFRNSSWYDEKMKESMISFMKKMSFSLVIVDQPQVALHSVPFDVTLTNLEFVFVRLHGRNKGNWLDNSDDWRKKRNLYCYSREELTALANSLKQLSAKDIYVIFNNNSAQDAAPNGTLLKNILGVEYQGLNPKQTSLF
ncbi:MULTISPECIES: DUF72 domain-containing protein [Vagococcus]|uniref:DUF72 domain-containing protein n=1 Tax=Vagococcus fluvialis bH819 TaxID=1255619 RepID=A0A1X6WM08_9ENTE|nr:MULTISPECIES: DUF72 domain-containing protein [Vagococcus]SLM85307.1 hypothetical protein FM121_04365 [Vagococcus fluvialis bH819]HCM89398.1 DUF72 domain-containing protein [Vagococcus sp.]